MYPENICSDASKQDFSDTLREVGEGTALAVCVARKRRRTPQHTDPAHLRAAQCVQGHAQSKKYTESYQIYLLQVFVKEKNISQF